MARKSRGSVNASATRRSRSVQFSRIFSEKTIAHDALTRHRQSAQQSDLEGLHANNKRHFPTGVSPLRVLASLNAIESAISRSTGQMIDEKTETAHDTIMRNETTEVVHSPRPGPAEAYFSPSHYDDSSNFDREKKPTSRDEMEGGKDHKTLEGKKYKRKSAGRKNTSKPETPEEPTDADNAAKLAEPEEKRNGTEEPRYEVEKIVGHCTKNETEVELMVKWTGCFEPTLIDERTFQQNCPHALYRYWESLGTREKATGIRLEFHAFRIRDWKRKDEKLLLQVQWVGYPPKDSTWEFAWRVEIFAKEMHTQYLKTHPAARNAWEKGKKTKA